MRKRLFDPETERFTEKALEFSTEIFNAIKPIIDKYAAEGYSIRDMGSIASSEVDLAVLCRII